MTGSGFCRVTEEGTPSLIYGVHPDFWAMTMERKQLAWKIILLTRMMIASNCTM
jgi:hypothetical protein